MRASLAVVAAALLINGHAAAQTAPADPSVSQEPPATEVEEVVVTGRRLETAIQEYVDSVSAPPRTRGLARWDDTICVDVVNAQPAVAAELAGRIRQVGSALGIGVEADGCDPNLVVLATDDGAALAETMVDRFRSQFFRLGYTRSNRGSASLTEFQTSDAPVRWWHVSLPVHAVTGEVMIRLPGKERVTLPCHSRSVATKDISIAHLGGARSGTGCNGVSDQIIGLWIVVDVTAAAGLSVTQLADYLAFVAMAQVEPEADTSAFDTVLNLFDAPDSVNGITEWDEAYLTALYSGENERIDGGEQAERMVGSLRPPTREP